LGPAPEIVGETLMADAVEQVRRQEVIGRIVTSTDSFEARAVRGKFHGRQVLSKRQVLLQYQFP